MRIEEKFLDIVKENEKEIALKSDKEGQMTYGELNSKAEAVAEKIRKIDTDVLGVCIERSFNLIIGILAVLKAGKAYLPLDSSYPKERLEHMITSAKVETVICSASTRGFFSCNVFDIEKNIAINNQVECSNRMNDIAYILFTSGSTGNPQGVPIKHESIMNTINWRINYYGLNIDDVVMQIPSISFDSSVEDIFCTLLSGGTIFMLSETNRMDVKYLCNVIEKEKITHFLIVPSFYKIILNNLKGKNYLRFVVVAGENFTMELVEEHYTKLKEVKLFNEYGPTENSVCSFVHRINRFDKEVLIGRNIDNVKFRIDYIDEDCGELLLAGIGLTQGYINASEENKKRFIHIDGEMYYRTGDIVKTVNTGELKFCGRIDQQIKINGMRFDLNEIDAILRKAGFVQNCYTVVCQKEEQKFIVTFYVSDQNCEKKVLEDILSKKIPIQFIPKEFLEVDSFTYLPNGKVDIRALITRFETFNNKIAGNVKSRESDDDKLKKETICRIDKLLRKYLNRNLEQHEYEIDIRKIGIDSLNYIHFLVDIEEEFEFEFGYDDIDNFNVMSVIELEKYINSH